MMRAIDDPVAIADVTWLSPEEGGRKSGPPTAQVYAATCVFPLGDDATVVPGWPAAGDALSILLQQVDTDSTGVAVCKVDFLARDLARPFLVSGAPLLIMEGPAVVARATIREVTDAGRDGL